MNSLLRSSLFKVKCVHIGLMLIFGLAIATSGLCQSPYQYVSAQANFGGGSDLGVPSNIYLDSRISVAGVSLNVPLTPSSSVGIHFDSDVRRTNDQAFVEYMEVDTSRHKDLITLTRGNHNTWQFGVHYRYTHTFNKLFITAAAGVGVHHGRQNPHLMEFYPFDTTLYSYKRFVTTRSNQVAGGWGVQSSLKCDFGVSLNGWALFMGFGYVYGRATINNVYVAEYDRNDIDYFTYYSEAIRTSRFDVHAGVVFVLKPD